MAVVQTNYYLVPYCMILNIQYAIKISIHYIDCHDALIKTDLNFNLRYITPSLSYNKYVYGIDHICLIYICVFVCIIQDFIPHIYYIYSLMQHSNCSNCMQQFFNIDYTITDYTQ